MTAGVRIVSPMGTERPTNDLPLNAERDDGLAGTSRSRREAVMALSMSERLARLHEICKQMSAVKGSARRR
jgi:hypothetical protein